MASRSIEERARRSFSILSMPDLLKSLDHLLRTHALSFVVAIRIEENLLLRCGIEMEGNDNQSVSVHFHEVMIRRKMGSPLSGERDLAARSALYNLGGHEKVRKYVSKYIVLHGAMQGRAGNSLG